MPAKRLSNVFVRKVKPPDRGQISYIDTMQRGLALVLVVSYGGSKSFRVMWYEHGNSRTRTLGVYPKMRLAEARKAAFQFWEDPKRFQNDSGSFQAVAENWYKRHVEASGLRSARSIRRYLDKHILPKWKDRSFIEIRRGDVNQLLDSIVDKHSKTVADAVLSILRSLMNWHQTRDEDYTNPVVKGMRRARKGQSLPDSDR